MSTMVYQYGLLPPVGGGAHVREQMWLAHCYRNMLTEIERARRSAARSEYGPIKIVEDAASAALSVVAEANAKIKAARSSTRSRSETAVMRDELAKAKDVAREAKSALYEARRMLREGGSLSDRMEEIETLAGALRRGARAICGVHWGTYSLIEAEDDASRKMPLFDGVEPNDPRFSRWVHEGQVGLQVHQKGEGGTGLTVEEVHAGIPGEWFRVERVKDDRQGRRGGSRALLHVRLGTREDGTAIVASWPMTMHRPLPPGSLVRRVSVSCRRIGARERWTVEITIQTPSPERSCGPAGSFVAVNIGWRTVPGGLRVATWHGSDGQTGALLLDSRQIGAIRKAEDLRSIRDKHFDAMRGALAKWLAAQVEVPVWLTERTKSMAQWRGKDRLASLALAWRDARFDGDEEISSEMEVWRRKDKHLWDWESSQIRKSMLRRRETYRVWGAEMARRYEAIGWGEANRSGFALRTEEATNETARSNRQLASTFEMERDAGNAFVSRGGSSEQLPAANVTHECHACGTVDDFDAATELAHTCSGCGAVWDQDANAAKVLCERWRDVRSEGAARTAESKEKTGSKWQKRAAKKAEREAVRKASDKAAE